MSEHTTEKDMPLQEARELINETFAFALKRREIGRSSMPIRLDDVFALVALAALAVDALAAGLLDPDDPPRVPVGSGGKG